MAQLAYTNQAQPWSGAAILSGHDFSDSPSKSNMARLSRKLV